MRRQGLRAITAACEKSAPTGRSGAAVVSTFLRSAELRAQDVVVGRDLNGGVFATVGGREKAPDLSQGEARVLGLDDRLQAVDRLATAQTRLTDGAGG